MSRGNLSWTPKRRGNIYCSPACGYGCTYNSFLEAHKKAQNLAINLGMGWKPRVWENLGWYYCAIKNESGVYPKENCGYWASLCLGGHQFTGTSCSPKKSVTIALEVARQLVAKVAADIARI